MAFDDLPRRKWCERRRVGREPGPESIERGGRDQGNRAHGRRPPHGARGRRLPTPGHRRHESEWRQVGDGDARQHRADRRPGRTSRGRGPRAAGRADRNEEQAREGEVAEAVRLRNTAKDQIGEADDVDEREERGLEPSESELDERQEERRYRDARDERANQVRQPPTGDSLGRTWLKRAEGGPRHGHDWVDDVADVWVDETPPAPFVGVLAGGEG